MTLAISIALGGKPPRDWFTAITDTNDDADYVSDMMEAAKERFERERAFSTNGKG